MSSELVDAISAIEIEPAEVSNKEVPEEEVPEEEVSEEEESEEEVPEEEVSEMEVSEMEVSETEAEQPKYTGVTAHRHITGRKKARKTSVPTRLDIVSNRHDLRRHWIKERAKKITQQSKSYIGQVTFCAFLSQLERLSQWMFTKSNQNRNANLSIRKFNSEMKKWLEECVVRADFVRHFVDPRIAVVCVDVLYTIVSLPDQIGQVVDKLADPCENLRESWAPLAFCLGVVSWKRCPKCSKPMTMCYWKSMSLFELCVVW